ncbi:MAG: preprotein translocase subunit SecA [Fibrobacteria bacterium]|nr:preprotein translocase subunit SecA [Fibrobacteria bacterium]
MILDAIFTKLFGTPHERYNKKLTPAVEAINALEETMRGLHDDELALKTVEFRRRMAEQNETLDDLLPEAFAVVREAADRRLGIFNVLNPDHGFDLGRLAGSHQKLVEEARTRLAEGADVVDIHLPADFYDAIRALYPESLPPFRMRVFDVQMRGGMILHSGKIAEMKTGEGKTLVATTAVYLNALTALGVHVVTVNDYLAKRDSEWMGRLYRFLGLTVGLIVHEKREEERRAAYHSDITYGTNNEFGFDYLRDNMARHPDECVQRKLNFAIVDEVDSILIDEARTPLIISGPAEESTDKYGKADAVIPLLKKDIHYTVEEKHKNAMLTDRGVEACEKALGIQNLYGDGNTDWVHHLSQALRAHVIYKKDVDYVVKDGEVVIVDEFTGRTMEGRRWSDGLHQAVEAKEKVRIARENQTLATITFQNYFRMYTKLGGMTGTADTEAHEFHEIYKLGVVVVPTNRPMIRKDRDDWVFRTDKEKYEAIQEDIKERNALGQPILVGTVTIEKSELLSGLLQRAGVAHDVLNAKQHQREATIVAEAGHLGRVTIATNMAGRGTDIVLRNTEWKTLLEHWKAKGIAPKDLPVDEASQDEALLAHWAERTLSEKERAKFQGTREEKLAFLNKVREEQEQPLYPSPWDLRAQGTFTNRLLGGLHIVGTERHESRRIDNQLRGRSGRQGDPGSSRFFLSLDDDLMRIFGGDNIRAMMDRLGAKEGEVITHPLLNRSIAGAQKRVEGQNFEVRKHLLEYDDVMNAQRTVVYKIRRKILDGEDIRDEIVQRLEEAVEIKITEALAQEFAPDDPAWEAADQELRRTFLVDFSLRSAIAAGASRDSMVDEVIKLIEARYQKVEEAVGEEQVRELERQLLLIVIDNLWKAHLYEMDHLKEAIRFRGYGQKDPLSEYKREAFALFDATMDRLAVEIAARLLHLDPANLPMLRMSRTQREMHEMHAQFQAQQAAAGQAAPQAAPAMAPLLPGTRPMMAPPPQMARPAPSPAFVGVGRNDPCPCGSGKKFKKCHGEGL